MAPRITTYREQGGYHYEIRDTRGVLRGEGWSAGNKPEALAEAKQHARDLGLENK
jgi:hypothetical protein